MLALEPGEIDYLSIYGLPSSAVPDLQKNKDIIVFTAQDAGELRRHHGAHQRAQPESGQVKEVRQALSYAIDRKLIVERAIGGLGVPASSPISSFHQPWFNPAVADRYTYRSEESRSSAGRRLA